MKDLTSKSAMEFQRDIGIALKKLRLKAGHKTSKSFALKYDLPEIQYWRMENGKANLTLRSISKVLNIHGIGMAEFFKKVDEYKVTTSAAIVESGLLSQCNADDLLLAQLLN